MADRGVTCSIEARATGRVDYGRGSGDDHQIACCDGITES